MKETSLKDDETTLGMVTPILKLSKLQLRMVFTAVLQKPAPGENIVLATEEFRALVVADLLTRLAFLEHEQRITVMTEMQALLAAHDEEFAQLVFADGNYCTWTGRTGFLDLTSGETVTELPVQPVETIGYNLSALYTRAKQQIAKRKRRHAKEPSARSLDEPGDLCDGPPDPIS